MLEEVKHLGVLKGLCYERAPPLFVSVGNGILCSSAAYKPLRGDWSLELNGLLNKYGAQFMPERKLSN